MNLLAQVQALIRSANAESELRGEPPVVKEDLTTRDPAFMSYAERSKLADRLYRAGDYAALMARGLLHLLPAARQACVVRTMRIANVVQQSGEFKHLDAFLRNG